MSKERSGITKKVVGTIEDIQLVMLGSGITLMAVSPVFRKQK